jgi:hypothetical protein
VPEQLADRGLDRRRRGGRGGDPVQALRRRGVGREVPAIRTRAGSKDGRPGLRTGETATCPSAAAIIARCWSTLRSVQAARSSPRRPAYGSSAAVAVRLPRRPWRARCLRWISALACSKARIGSRPAAKLAEAASMLRPSSSSCATSSVACRPCRPCSRTTVAVRSVLSGTPHPYRHRPCGSRRNRGAFGDRRHRPHRPGLEWRRQLRHGRRRRAHAHLLLPPLRFSCAIR